MKLARDVALGQRMFFRKNRKYVYPPLKAEAALTSKMGGLPKKFKVIQYIFVEKRRSIAFIYRKKLLITNFHAISVYLSDYIK